MSSSALFKISRIKKNSDIQHILRCGKKVYTPFGIFFMEKQAPDHLLSFAVLVKKNIGNAVYRNYCKRVTREFFRNNKELFKSYSKIVFLFNFNGSFSYHTFCLQLKNAIEKV